MSSERIQKVLAGLAPWFLLLLALGLLAPGNATAPLIDRDEPRFAQATREMIAAHDWVIPTFNGDYRFDKPALTYWVMGAGYRLFGENEFGARFHSVVFSALTAMLLYAIGRRWYSARAGFLAGFGFLTCVQVLIHGRSAVADMPMLFFVMVAQWAICELLTGGYSRRWFWTLYGALGLGFLAKGPIAWLVPLLTLLLCRFIFFRKPYPWRNLRIPAGLPIVLLLIGFWGIPALIRTHGQFWQVGMNEHVVERGVRAFNGRGSFILYYLGTSFFSLFPWIAFLGVVIRSLKKNWNARTAFLVSWTLAPYFIFTFYSTQLPHYVLPAFPAFFLLLAQAFETEPEWKGWPLWFFRIVTGFFVLAAALLMGIAWRVPFAASFQGLRVMLAGLSGIILGLMLLVWLYKHHRPRAYAFALLLVVAGFVVLSHGLRSITPAVQMQALFRQLPAQTECVGYRFREPSLVFYSNHRWVEAGDLEVIRRSVRQPGPRCIVVTEREMDLDDYLKYRAGKYAAPPFQDFSEELAELDFTGYTELRFEGLNIARSRWVVLKVFYRPS